MSDTNGKYGFTVQFYPGWMESARDVVIESPLTLSEIKEYLDGHHFEMFHIDNGKVALYADVVGEEKEAYHVNYTASGIIGYPIRGPVIIADPEAVE